MTKRFELNADAVLVLKRVRVTGTRTRTQKLGVSFDSQTGVETDSRRVDRDRDPAEFKPADTLKQRVNGIIRRATVSTPIGLLTNLQGADALRAALDAVKPDVDALNAAHVRHRVMVEVGCVPIGTSLAAMSETLAHTYASIVEQARSALASGDPKQTRNVIQRWSCADTLLVGVLRDSFCDAMRAFKQAHARMVKRAKNGETQASIARAPETAPEFDAFASMLRSFAPSANADEAED